MGEKSNLEIDGRTVTVSNLDKVMYPITGFTKANVIDYYINVSRYILPHLRDRPLTLKRYPDGAAAEHFYEKNAPSHKPDWVKVAAVPRVGQGKSGRKDMIRYVLVNDVATLVWAANLASLELHVLLAQAPRVKQPTSVVFDLDPGEPANVLDCARVSVWIRDLVSQLGLKCFVKSSGSKGLQLYIPLNSPATYEATSAFAKAIAESLKRAHPDSVESAMAKDLRKGKVFIDWSQNSETKTTVCVYSLRAKPDGPYVSLPFTWEEVEEACKKQDSKRFFVRPAEALKRLKKIDDLFAPVLTVKQKLPDEFEGILNAVAPDGSDNPVSRKSSKAQRLRGVGDRSLNAYKAKRDFKQTPEPGPSRKRQRNGNGPLFVIQKHQARNLHFDFRLEMDGVLKSWAVPKGPPYTRAERRLAMWVEDHPLDYARFEGVIAPGNYGAGTVMVWDIGTYEIMDGSFKQGKLHLMLHGKKLKGEWILVRSRKTEDEEKQPWFLIKSGESMDPPVKEDRSVLSRRTMDEITEAADAEWKSNRKAVPRSKRLRIGKKSV